MRPAGVSQQEHVQPRQVRRARAQALPVLLAHVPGDRRQGRVDRVSHAERRAEMAQEPRGGRLVES